MLEIKRENTSKSKVKLTVHLPSELMRGFFAKTYNKMASDFEVKGFRKGMAPRSMTIAAIGENKLVSEIINLALSETYPKALKQEKLIPIAPPRINIKMMKDLTVDTAELEYEAEIDLIPDVKIGNYKKIKIKPSKEKVEATKDEIDQVLSHLQRQHATFKDIDRPAKEGDRVEIDFEGTERGVKLENLSSHNYPAILGNKVLIPEFEKSIEGMKKGEDKEFDLKIKDKQVHFKVKMLDVKEVILPLIDDELAKKFKQDNLEKFKKAIEEDIVRQKNLAEKQNIENQLIEELLKISEVEVPESLAEQESLRMIGNLKARVASSGMPFEKYLEQMKKSEEDLKKDFKPQAEKTVKIGLILGEIGKKENIDLKENEAGKKVMEKLLEYAEK